MMILELRPIFPIYPTITSYSLMVFYSCYDMVMAFLSTSSYLVQSTIVCLYFAKELSSTWEV